MCVQGIQSKEKFILTEVTPLVFILALIPLSLILRKAKATYEFSVSKERINHLLFMDNLK